MGGPRTKSQEGRRYWLVMEAGVERLRAMALRRELASVWRGFARTWRTKWKRWLLLVVMLLGLTGAVLFPNDLGVLRWVQGPEGFDGLEEGLEFWGDFLQFNVAWAAVIWMAGAVRRDRWLRRAALVFLLGGVLSGVTARVVKFSAGRARPSMVEKLDLPAVTFKGPSGSAKYHSYFSGHTAATFGSAVALALVVPQVGWIAVLFAAAVGWSRMYGNHHFPSDVLHGAIWGTMWGCFAGWGMARLRWRRQRASGSNRQFPNESQPPPDKFQASTNLKRQLTNRTARPL